MELTRAINRAARVKCRSLSHSSSVVSSARSVDCHGARPAKPVNVVTTIICRVATEAGRVQVDSGATNNGQPPPLLRRKRRCVRRG